MNVDVIILLAYNTKPGFCAESVNFLVSMRVKVLSSVLAFSSKYFKSFTQPSDSVRQSFLRIHQVIY